MPLLETVEVIYWAGGEPLLQEEHYEILKRLSRLGGLTSLFTTTQTYQNLNWAKTVFFSCGENSRMFRSRSALTASRSAPK